MDLAFAQLVTLYKTIRYAPGAQDGMLAVIVDKVSAELQAGPDIPVRIFQVAGAERSVVRAVKALYDATGASMGLTDAKAAVDHGHLVVVKRAALSMLDEVLADAGYVAVIVGRELNDAAAA
jgi:hypothetical protein